MVNNVPGPAEVSDPYFDAALRWFDGASSIAQARALIDGRTDEPALWQSFKGFGLAELLADEPDTTERARIVAGVGRAAGKRLYVGPVAAQAGGSTQDGAKQADGTVSGWQEHPQPQWQLPIDDAGQGTQEKHELAVLCTCSRLLGAAQQVLALAIDHLATRKQFGRPLASFQALQHSTVDRHCDLVLADALLAQCVEHWDEPALRRTALHAMKDMLSHAAVAAAEHAVQMLGAMGFTHESDVGLYLRHTLVLAARHGTAATHRRAFAGLELDFLA
jgi:hypothetical protein